MDFEPGLEVKFEFHHSRLWEFRHILEILWAISQSPIAPHALGL